MSHPVRFVVLSIVAFVSAACDRAPDLVGDYRSGSQLFRVREDNSQVSLENWDMDSASASPAIVVPMVWKDSAFRGNAQLVGELSVAKSETGILVLGAGKRWEAKPFTLPSALPTKDEATTSGELLAALMVEVDERIKNGTCGNRKMIPERKALIDSWFKTLKSSGLTISTLVETPFLVRRKVEAKFEVSQFTGPEGTVNAFSFLLTGKDSIGIMKDLGVDSVVHLESIDGNHRPWGNLGDYFCDDFFYSKKLGAAKYVNEPAPKPYRGWFR